jgi:hypothetical protein
MTVATFQTAIFGAQPFNQIDGPTGTTGTGTILPQFAPGHVAYGDMGSEYTYCKLVLASATTLLPGQVYVWDDDFVASPVTTTNGLLGMRCGVANVLSYSLAAGTYYFWLQHAGQCAVRYTTQTVNKAVETTATAGAINAPSSATTTTKKVQGIAFTKAIATFTGTITNGSSFITGPFTGVSVQSGPYVGASISGTGIPASTQIGSINVAGGQVVSIQMVTSAGVAVNGTATGAGVTVTPSLISEARLAWPQIDVTN